MSSYSGKCDLFDHIMMQKMYDRGSVRVSDELECFNIFKEKTGGILYQHQEVEVTEYNQDYVAQQCKEFKIIPHTTVVSDKRLKAGEKEVTTYTYKYYSKEYKNLAELNKHGVYIATEIHFDTLLDLIPYYPYIITFSAWVDGRAVVYISSESYVAEECRRAIQYGHTGMGAHYQKRLQEHYLEVCEKYFLYQLAERTKTLLLNKDMCEKYDDTYYKLVFDEELDYMHTPEYQWVDQQRHSHWTSPKLLDKHTILLHKQDVESYLAEDMRAHNVQLKYVINCDFPKDLD